MRDKVIVFDLDGTLLDTKGMNYAGAEPKWAVVKKLRSLILWNTIVIQTARAKRWEEFTKAQLKKWGIPYDLLSVGDKVPGDIYVDDKGINDKDFFDGLE